MENYFLPPQSPREEDDDYENTDGVWEFFGARWNPTIGVTDAIDKSVLISTRIWEHQMRALYGSRILAKDFVKKLKEHMKLKLDIAVAVENRRRMEGQQSDEGDQWLQVLHLGNMVLPELPDPIQNSLRGEQLPPREQHDEEARRIINALTEGKNLEYISQLHSSIQNYKGNLSFFQLNPLWAFPTWERELNKILWVRGPIGENPMVDNNMTSENWKETFMYVNQHRLHRWASLENGVPFRTQKLLLDHYTPPSWLCVYQSMGRAGFSYTKPQIPITINPESCTGEENKRPWPARQEGFPIPEENEDEGLEKDVGFGDSQTIQGFDLRYEKLFSLQKTLISHHENHQMWPSKGSPRCISYKLLFKEYDTEVLKKAIIRGPSGLDSLKPLYFKVSQSK